MPRGNRMSKMANLHRENVGLTDKRCACRLTASINSTLNQMRSTIALANKMAEKAPGGVDGILTELQAEQEGADLCRDLGDLLDSFTQIITDYAKLDDPTQTNPITRAQVDTFLA